MRRHAKASSAGSNQRQATGLGRVFRGAFDGRGASSGVDGSGAPAASRSRLALLATAAVAAFLLLPASGALASGDVAVKVAGTGAGTVTSTSEVIAGSATVTPGQIDCDNSGGPICDANYFFNFFGFTTVTVTLTATPDSGGGPFTGWLQSGASSVVEGCANPAGTPETCKITLTGNPGPKSEVIAIFGDPPVPPPVVTGATGPGADFSLSTLEGTVDPGGAAITDCYFEYGTSTDYGTTVPCEQSEADIGTGTGPVAVSASTEPLERDTTYHYRLIASSEVAEGLGGVSVGEDESFTTDPAPADACPNASIRAEQGIAALSLPDCMALEMVSPPNKGGQAANAPEVSATGARVKFNSTAALADVPNGPTTSGHLYVASRENTGWTTAHTVPPQPFTAGWQETAAAESLGPDFSSWFHIATTDPLRDLGRSWALRGGLDGVFEPISPLLIPEGGGEGRAVVNASFFQGASADHTRLLFGPGGSGIGVASTSYLDHDPSPAGPGSSSNVYIAELDPAGQPSLTLLSRGIDASNGKVKVFGANCGARVGNVEGPLPSAVKRNQGAVSVDGSRILFSTRPGQPATGNCSASNNLRILERVETAQGPVISELFKSECARKAPEEQACSTAAGDDFFQGASLDQSKVYFTTTRQLASSDLDAPLFSSCSNAPPLITGCDLYLYDSAAPLGERLTQVSAGEDVAGHEEGKDAKVLNGTVAISADGSRVYFVAEGVLTDDEGPKGDKASEYAAGAPKLYVWDAEAEVLGDAEPLNDGEALSFIGVLDAADTGGTQLWGGQGTWRNEAYPVPVRGPNGTGTGDGHILLFLSKASLTEDDGDGGFQDAFRYDAEADELVRVSKAAAGGSDNGPFDLGGRGNAGAPGTELAEVNRWASEDGETVAFRTAEALLPGDGNGDLDTYLWREGELYRLPGTTGETSGDGGDTRPALSHDGDTVAFQASIPLLPIDGDGSADIYVARVEGGYPNPAVEPPCEPDRSQPGPHCRDDASSPPSAAGAASTSAQSGGNLPPDPFARCNRAARRAKQTSNRAKRLRRNARRVNRSNHRRAVRMSRKARRLGKRAKGLSKHAKRCRARARANRRASR